MSSSGAISELDTWLGVETAPSSVTPDPVAVSTNEATDLPQSLEPESVTVLQRLQMVSLRGKSNIEKEVRENPCNICNTVTGCGCARVVPSSEVLESAELARLRNKRDRDLIALMHPCNVDEWTWLEHGDGRWTAHHSFYFTEAE